METRRITQQAREREDPWSIASHFSQPFAQGRKSKRRLYPPHLYGGGSGPRTGREAHLRVKQRTSWLSTSSRFRNMVLKTHFTPQSSFPDSLSLPSLCPLSGAAGSSACVVFGRKSWSCISIFDAPKTGPRCVLCDQARRPAVKASPCEGAYQEGGEGGN